MRNGDILILREQEVRSLLEGRELEIIQTVSAAYQTHAQRDSSLPHSVFLRFPHDQRNRIIALPAYLGGQYEIAGIKWVSSFPGNLDHGLDRASAVVILNSLTTGRVEAILEGSVVNAKRTAASAALAARCLHRSDHSASVGVIGCGVINFEVIRFLRAVLPELRSFVIFDVAPERALQFEKRCYEEFGEIEVERAANVNVVLRCSSLISLATTAVVPHILDLSGCAAGCTILHISLRDLSPEIILSCDNIVDDIDHVCRAQTSVHLTELRVNHRGFIRCTLADILMGKVAARDSLNRIAIFSPFGLGILDIALGKLIYEIALAESRGMVVESFWRKCENENNQGHL